MTEIEKLKRIIIISKDNYDHDNNNGQYTTRIPIPTLYQADLVIIKYKDRPNYFIVKNKWSENAVWLTEDETEKLIKLAKSRLEEVSSEQ